MSPSTRNCIRLLGVTAIAALCVASPASARTVSLSWAEADFTSPTLITNTFWPLPEDATFIYMAETADGCEINVVDVLAPGDENGTKQITFDGTTVQARVVLDQAYEADDCDLPPDPDDLVEKTHDWFAQDDDGNIWYLGEDSRECEEGVCDAAPGEGSWEAGQEIGDTETIAEPGIIMLAEPQSGDRYRQEFAPDVALDWGMVMNLGASVRLRRDDAFGDGTFEDCIVTKEWNELEPGHIEQKTYCSGVGLLLVEEHHGAIVRLERVDPEEVDDDAFEFRVPPKD
jgi:hypothetical protein